MELSNKDYCGYLYEIIIPTEDGLKHYYGKKELDKRIKKKNYIVETYFGSVSNISRCCRGLKNTYKGYHWEYVDD